jgi:phosphopantothenoylcysteine decarboxylase/phosphopantothenate--cysteine ligase
VSFALKKIRFLITYGPTQEPIDPVRFISNRSTGVLGRQLVSMAKARGHKVQTIECPVNARTALELQKALHKKFPRCDVLIMAAAVCDARPRHFSKTKLKKNSLSSIPLIKNPDILAGLAGKKRKDQLLAGFGIESSDLIKRGTEKLKKKHLDLMIMQKVTENDTPFGKCKLDAYFIEKSGACVKCPMIDKKQLAAILIRRLENKFIRD